MGTLFSLLFDEDKNCSIHQVENVELTPFTTFPKYKILLTCNIFGFAHVAYSLSLARQTVKRSTIGNYCQICLHSMHFRCGAWFSPLSYACALSLVFSKLPSLTILGIPKSLSKTLSENQLSALITVWRKTATEPFIESKRSK